MQHFVEDLTPYLVWGYVAFAVGGALSVYNMTRASLVFPLSVLCYTACVYAGILGTRVLFLLSYEPGLFLSDWTLLFARFWEGGLAWLGGPVVGCLPAIVFARIGRKPFWEVVGSGAPGIAVGHAVARIGCLLEGCCYGVPTSVPWAVYPRELNTRVHPTQLYDMACELAVALVLQRLWLKPERRKYLFPLYCLLLCVHRFITEAFRGTPSGPELIEGLRFYQSVCVFLFAVSLAALLVLWRGKKGVWEAAGLLAVTAGLALLFWHRSPGAAPQTPGNTGRYLVATRSMFAETLNPWIADREKAGFEVSLGAWDNAPSTEAVGAWIKAHADSAARYALIVGDCASEGEGMPAWHIPCPRSAAGNPCDARFGDLDGDGRPEIAVGRLAVRTRRELETHLIKIRQYETQPGNTRQSRAVLWVAAAPYNTIAASLLDRLDALVPGWITPVVLSGWEGTGIPLAEQPRRFLRAIAEPTFLSLVISHGWYHSIALSDDPESSVFLGVEDVRTLASSGPSGPLFLLGCSSGRFDLAKAEGPSLAEAFSGHPCGPIAVIAATGPTNAVTNYLVAKGIAEALHDPPRSAGNVLVKMQQVLCDAGQIADVLSRDAEVRSIYALMPPEQRAPLEQPGVLREEGLSYCLLGDPSAALRVPPGVRRGWSR